jgi:hypothetical protein
MWNGAHLASPAREIKVLAEFAAARLDRRCARAPRLLSIRSGSDATIPQSPLTSEQNMNIEQKQRSRNFINHKLVLAVDKIGEKL